MENVIKNLYNKFNENSETIMQNESQYVQSNIQSMIMLKEFKKSLTKEQLKLFNEYDDQMTATYSIMLEYFYKQGFKDAVELNK